MVKYWDISMANVDNIQHDNVVLNSAYARIGTTPKQKTLSSKVGCWTPPSAQTMFKYLLK